MLEKAQQTKTQPLPPLILLHGLRGTHDGLTEIAKALQVRGFLVLNPDLPGSGDSKALPSPSLLAYLAWLKQYIVSQNFLEPPVLIGHSMGSIIVSHFIARFPSYCHSKTVLIAPILRRPFAQKINSLNYQILATFLRCLPLKTRTRLLKSDFVSFCISHFLTVDKSKQKAIDLQHYRYSGRFASADSLLADIRLSTKHTTIFPATKKILVIAGDHDRLTSKKLLLSLSKHTKLKLHLVKNTGHLINYEQPEFVAEFIADFLKEAKKAS